MNVKAGNSPLSFKPRSKPVQTALQGITDTANLLGRIAAVIKELDPDVLTVQEGPSTLARMQLFVDEFLDGDYLVFGKPDPHSNQQLYALVRKNGPIENPRIFQEADEFLSKPWSFDISGNCTLEEYHFERQPLVIIGDVLVTRVTPPDMYASDSDDGSGDSSSSDNDGDEKEAEANSRSGSAAADSASAAKQTKQPLVICTLHSKSKYISGGKRLAVGSG